MATLEKLVLYTKGISNRLNEKMLLGASLINEIEFVNEQLKSLRTLKAKRPNNPIIMPETTWSQEQLQLLELAIVKYPKTAVGDRWVKIANSIPGKTREECLARYKHLVEIVKAQKERAKTDEQPTNEPVTSNKADDEQADDITQSNDVDEEEVEEPPKKGQNKGKPKNKRKERKNRMDFSSDEDDYSN